MTFLQHNEFNLLYLACTIYAAFALLALFPSLNEKFRTPAIALLVVALTAHTLSITTRWIRIEHGPFINLYEILTSNLWSNMLGLTIFFILAPGAVIVFRYLSVFILVMVAWLLVVPVYDTHLPPTYNTTWLYFHVFTGKVFFTLLLLSTGLAIHSLVSRFQGQQEVATRFTSSAHVLLAFAFVFEALMLLFGAIWAQDAWGRYWSWDPLETWAFSTWMVVAFTLHIQVNTRQSKLFSWLVPLCFVLAFLTFYGVPFISTAAHKGMV